MVHVLAYGRDVDDGPTSTGDPEVVHGPFGDSAPVGPGVVTDDDHLRTLRRTVVEPVVRSLLTEGELEQITVSWAANGDPGDVWVHVVAAGEVFGCWMFSRSWPGHGPDGDHTTTTPQECAERLADQLEDWIAESRFGWGQQRTARYVLPPS